MFQVDDQIKIVQPDIGAIKKAIRVFLDTAKSNDNLLGISEKFQATVINRCNRLLAQTGDEIVLSTVEWNYCLYALTHVNVQVVLTAA